MTDTQHLHTLQLDSITDVPGLTGRKAAAHCTTCEHSVEILTNKTDAEVQSAIDEINAEANSHA